MQHSRRSLSSIIMRSSLKLACPERNRASRSKKTKLQASISLWCPRFLHSVRSVVILLHGLRVAVLTPCHGMTISREHCSAGHVQA